MIGRRKEIQCLKELYDSGTAQLVAIHGRRRVGKTFLINETFRGKITFHHAGLSSLELNQMQGSSPLRKQLKHFYNSLILHGMKKSRCPDNWLDAFLMLELFLQSQDQGQRMLIFLDELPWMDTQRSGFMTAFEGFWNSWGCSRPNLMVVVCGSSTSWILDKLINNHGGMYNRVTYEIALAPFTLKECEEFLKSKGVRLSRYDIVQAYMIVGGIPYYLNYFRKGLSLSQNVDQLFFDFRAPLRNEYDRLFNSVFSNPEMMKSIVDCLHQRNSGYTRPEIAEKTGISPGGTFSDALSALESGDFIIRYVPFGMSKKEERYKLTDPFCLFYLRFVQDRDMLNDSFWQQNVISPSVAAWRGIAFENVCFRHIAQIKQALGISGVSTRQSAWSKRADDQDGTQIDLIIERKDQVTNMCEIKFSTDKFSCGRDYHATLIRRRAVLEEALPPHTVVHSTLISTYGLVYNEYSGDFDSVITMEDLFS